MDVDAIVPLVLAHLGRDEVREAIVETGNDPTQMPDAPMSVPTA
jgi:hypothetical protein